MHINQGSGTERLNARGHRLRSVADPRADDSSTDQLAHLCSLEAAIREAVQLSTAADGYCRSVRSNGCGLYLVHDLTIGIYHPLREPNAPNASPAEPLLYRATSYGEVGADGELRLTPIRTRTFLRGGVAPEYATQVMGFARFFALRCQFCGQRSITLWKRCLARCFDDVRCPVCNRQYGLDAAKVRRYVDGPVLAALIAGSWLSGSTHSIAPVVCGMLVLIIAEITTTVFAPQR